ncbi:phage tail tape measure protein, partial [Streptomyces sp. NPDC005878]|uniref:phage tail tape measure protein n=1 Tax=Streptomyces sp. NPDC005878 TaxID=3157077 RepID=UPI0033F7953F
MAADTLAATANAASGGITDIYYAMKYAGPVAHGIGMSMQEAAAGVGMLHKAGIIGQTAGTSLRGMFTNMAKPTHQMSVGLHDLGIEAYDAQGNFKGLRYVVEGLEKAQHRMSQQDFTAAAAKAFGKPALSGAMALAHQGVQSYDALFSTIRKTGAVTELAEAQGKGLAGAMVQLKTQARQTGLAIYQGMAPGLEWLTRGMTTGLNKATPHIEHFFQYLNDAATLLGPDIEAAMRREAGGIGNAVSKMVGPFKDIGNKALADFLHLLLSLGDQAARILVNIVHGVDPIVHGFAEMASGGDTVVTSLDLVVMVLDAVARALGYVSGVLVPVGQAVGSLAHGFASLPGPIQQFILAALLVRRLQGPMNSLASTVGGRVTGAYRSLGQQMAVQRTLAATAGISLTRYGAAMAVLQTRVPAIGAMGAAFRTASASGTRFTGTLRGVAAAAGSGLRSAATGIVGAFGGPWGLAITGATLGLGLLASHQQKAAAAAAEHRQQISNLSQALRESNGAVDENVRAIATENLMAKKVKTTLDGQRRLIDVAKDAKVPMGDLVDAYTQQGTSLEKLKTQLDAVAKAHVKEIVDPESGLTGKGLDKEGQAAADLSKALGGLGDDYAKAAADAKAFKDGVGNTGKATTAYDKLKTSVKALADTTGDADTRTRALRNALDLLSGGSISLQAAQARVHEAITNANEAMAAGVNHADGWHQQLLKTNGAIDTTTKNGQALFSTLDSIAESSSQAALAAFDFAKSQGKDVPEAVAAARKEMQDARDSAIKLAGGYGLTKDEAAGVADAMGLIPGQVSILLTTKGLDTALAELLGVQAEFQRFPKKTTVTVEALGEDAKKELLDLGYKMETLSTREIKITAPTLAARHELDLLITKLATTNGKTLPIKAPSAAARKELSSIEAKVAGMHGKTLTMKAPTAEAQAQLQALGFSIRQNARDKTVTISLPTGGPISAAAAIQAAISNIHGHDVGIGVYLKATSSDSDANGVPDMIQNPQARGSVLDFYAAGVYAMSISEFKESEGL